MVVSLPGDARDVDGDLDVRVGIAIGAVTQSDLVFGCRLGGSGLGDQTRYRNQGTDTDEHNARPVLDTFPSPKP
jgi:hypothetical protein